MRMTLLVLAAALLSTGCGSDRPTESKKAEEDKAAPNKKDGNDQPVELGDTTSVPPDKAQARAGSNIYYPEGKGIKPPLGGDVENAYYILMEDNYQPTCVVDGKLNHWSVKGKKSWEVEIKPDQGPNLKITWDESHSGQIRIHGHDASAPSAKELDYTFTPTSGWLRIESGPQIPLGFAVGGGPNYARYVKIDTCPNGKCTPHDACGN